MIHVGIIGITGYAGAELARLLMAHPEVEIVAASSVSFSGQALTEVYPAYRYFTNLICGDEDTVIEKSDVIFAALPHGLSQKLAKKVISAGKKFIDLGADFRLESEDVYHTWYGGEFEDEALHEQAVYGLPEFFRKEIKETQLVANPGCYTTAVPLALAPLLANYLVLDWPIICDCKSGVTGAGRKLTQSSHFPIINEACHPYSVAGHRHTPEIEQTLSKLAQKPIKVTFTPHLIPVNRGILATCYTSLKDLDENIDFYQLYEGYYKNEPFIRVLPEGQTANIANVQYSNFVDISVHYDKHTNIVITVAALDNMVKGAAGQAIQNMNIICGLPETTGLLMIPPAF